MDDILADMADKWDSLSQAQQVALAQSVAGVRQYTQLIALMENWEFMETNLDTVAASEGTLQEQADIYAESWAAAKKEVKASLESLYNELIPTDFLVNMTNAFGDVVDGMTVFVKGLGGLQGILLAISTIVMHKFQPAIA
jgi:TP901 family phage tail tape measure protein